jgi:hypothetical protein
MVIMQPRFSIREIGLAPDAVIEGFTAYIASISTFSFLPPPFSAAKATLRALDGRNRRDFFT